MKHINENNAVFETVKGLQAIPISDEFLRHGKIFLTDPINMDSTNSVIQQLLYLEQNEDVNDITLFISSPGGDVSTGLVLYDYIRMVSAVKTVKTMCLGICASMGALLFLAGDERCMTSHGEIMLHDPSYAGGHDSGGKKPHELQIELNHLNECRERTGKVIAERTGMTLDEVYKITKKDSYFNAEEAMKCNIATTIITNIKEI